MVLAAHVQKLLGSSAPAARARLRTLSDAGCLTQENRFYQKPACYLVTSQGLAAVGSGYARPRFNYAEYNHDVGQAWMWLAAKSGVWGTMSEVVSERQLRSRDARPDRSEQAMGVRLGGHGPTGKERLHYPDLLLVTPHGHRIALELELTAKSRTRLETILGGYAADGRIDAILYLVERRSIGRSIEAAARRFGIEDLVHVQMVKLDGAAKSGGTARTPHRTRGRPDRSAGDGPRTPPAPERARGGQEREASR